MDEIKWIKRGVIVVMLIVEFVAVVNSFRVPCGPCLCEDDLQTVYCEGRDLSHLGGIPDEVRKQALYVDASENMINGLYIEELSGYAKKWVRINVSKQRRQSCVKLMTEKPENIDFEGLVCREEEETYHPIKTVGVVNSLQEW